MALVNSHSADIASQPFDSKVTLKAAHALVRHLEKHRDARKVDKADLLADEDDENSKSKLDIPLWLTVNAKERIATSHSLNPGKVPVPHPLYSSPQTRICLITADPPTTDSRAYKNLVQHPSFPKDVREKLVKVVAFTKLAKKHKSFESRRLLLAEYDLFLADQRIVRLLPAALGKTFYKSTTKRPIPVELTGKENWGKKEKKTPLDRLKPKRKSPPTMIGAPEDVAADIEKAISTLAIHLSPSMSTSIKVGYASWPAEWIAENVDVAVRRVVTKYVPHQWNGVKSIHLKGPQTAALPIWMSDEVWQDESRILDHGEVVPFVKPKSDNTRGKRKAKALDDDTPSKPKKRKSTEDIPQQPTKTKKSKTVTIEQDFQQEKSSKSKKQQLIEPDTEVDIAQLAIDEESPIVRKSQRKKLNEKLSKRRPEEQSTEEQVSKRAKQNPKPKKTAKQASSSKPSK